MKKLFIGFASLLLVAAAPAPNGFVNDFANIIPDAREAGIEQSLREYERKTDIEIAVMTTPSLDGEEIEDYATETFRAWGVGKAGANNGVLVVVAPNERKYRIEVGYGLEGDLTDADAKTLAEANLVPAFKAQDYAGGIEHLTEALTMHLGESTPEQRAEVHRKMTLIQQQRRAAAGRALFETMSTVMVLLFVGAILWLIVGGIRILYRRHRTRVRNTQRRKAIIASLERAAKDAERLRDELAAIDLPNIPAWMQDEKETYAGMFEEAQQKALAQREKILNLNKDDLDTAERMLVDLRSYLAEASTALDLLRSIPEQVQAMREMCATSVEQACTAIDTLTSTASIFASNGYRIKDIVPSLDPERLAREKQGIKTLFDNRGEGPLDASESVEDKAARLLSKVNALQERLMSSVQLRSASEQRINALNERIESFPTLLNEHRARLERLRTMAPRNRWASFVEGMPVFERALSGIAPRVTAAVRANSMDAQLFTDAATTLAAAEAALSTIDAAMQAAEKLESAITHARENYPAAVRQVESAFTETQRLISNSDVGYAAKARLTEAQRLFQSIDARGQSPDWILIAGLVEQAFAKAKQAREMAKRDIDAAARERQRQRDEEDARRRRQEEASRASYSSGSIGGDSFGGFGGGTSGGAGATGGW